MEKEQLSNYSGNGRRRNERLFLGVLSVIMILFFFKLFGVLEYRMAETDTKIAAGNIVNLNAPEPVKEVMGVLERGNYDLDKRDIGFIGAVLGSRLEVGETFTNIGELNKRKYYVPAEEAYQQGGASFKKRVLLSRALLGFDEETGVSYDRELKQPREYPAAVDLKKGEFGISGEVLEKGAGVAGVLVKLQQVILTVRL